MKILMVDGNKDTRILPAILLRRAGYTVLEEESGLAALETIAADGDIGLVITGGKLDDMSGVDFSFRLNNVIPNMPLILTSGGNEPREHRAHLFLPRPYMPEKNLYDAIERLINKPRMVSNR